MQADLFRIGTLIQHIRSSSILSQAIEGMFGTARLALRRKPAGFSGDSIGPVEVLNSLVSGLQGNPEMQGKVEDY